MVSQEMIIAGQNTTLPDASKRQRAVNRHRDILYGLEMAGASLLSQKESGDWKALAEEDIEGAPFKNWTDYLERGFPESRKHLYELMRTAPVKEFLSDYGYKINTRCADVLRKFPQWVWIPAWQAATNRYGKITESNLERVASVLFQAGTGYVNTGDGDKTTPIDAALDLEDAEANARHKGVGSNKVHIAEAVLSQILKQEGNQFGVVITGLDDPGIVGEFLGANRIVHIDLWVEKDGG